MFPVPDGDTGTNMGLTINNAATELRKKDFDTVSAAADCVAGALLRGARGNSGVILSLLFRGISKRLKGLDTAGAVEFTGAMSDGVTAAYKAVMKPAEGTILTHHPHRFTPCGQGRFQGGRQRRFPGRRTRRRYQCRTPRP